MIDRPNILFILTDQQSATMMSCAGNDYLQTPAMDSLAASGVRFDHAYCTNPVCVPSRFSLLTGRMPSEIDLRSNDTSGIEKIPEEIKKHGVGWGLREGGYQPVYGGKVHLPNLTPEDLGFKVIETDERDQLAKSCSEWLSQPHQEPFFMVASFINPHDICYLAIRESLQGEHEKNLIKRGVIECQTLDQALIRPSGVEEDAFFSKHCPPLPDNFAPQADEPEAISKILKQRHFRIKARQEWDENCWRKHRWAYARLTEMVDQQINQILTTLRETRLDDNTVVIFTSDHGDMDSSHKMEHKTALYNEACRVPLIITHPGISCPGTINSNVVSNGLDLIPTICDYAGIQSPDDLIGKSLRPLVEDGIGEERAVIPVESEFGHAIVSDEFKYVLYDQGTNREQLYDLGADPGETRNTARDSTNLEILEEMRNEFEHRFGKQKIVTSSQGF